MRVSTAVRLLGRFIAASARAIARAPGRMLRVLGFEGLYAPDKVLRRTAHRLEPTPADRRAVGRWSRRLIFGFLGLNALWLAAAGAVAYVWPLAARLGGDAQWAEFERIAARARASALYDVKGRYFGILSASFERDHLGGLAQTTIDAAGVIPDHKAIPVSDAPRHFWRCLVYLEDRRRGGWDNPYGISFRGLAQIPYRLAWSSLSEGRPRLSGGSTLEMQLARSLWKQYRHNSSLWRRKLREWRAAPVLNHRLIDGEDDRRFRAWIAQHLALIQAAGGEQDVYGVDAAGRLLFGKPADALDAAEQLVLAAAVRRPLRLRAGAEARRAELARAIGGEERTGRAQICAGADAMLNGAPVIQDAALRAATAEKLDALAREPFAGPTVDADLAPYARRLLEHAAGPRLDPQRLAADLAYGLQIETQAALADMLAPDEVDPNRHPWRGRVAGVRLTLDLAKNLALERAIDAAVAEIEDGAQFGAPPALARDVLGAPGRRWLPAPSPEDNPEFWRTPYVMERRRRVPMIVVAADRTGRIVRLINTAADSLYGGAAATRDDWGFFGDGRYRPERERRAIASIGKVGAALLLAEAGMTDPTAGLSNRCPTGLSRRCQGPMGGGPRWVSARQAFAQSRNAAVTNALAARVSDARIDALAEALEFGDGGASRQAAPMPPPTRLTLGRYVARPLAVQRLMAAALAYAKGDFGARIPTPRLIEAIRGFDPDSETFASALETPAPAPDAIPLSRIVRAGPDAAASSRFVRDVLQAPICDQGETGRATLRRLTLWCALNNPKISLHLAKSGTIGAAIHRESYDESDWWIAGAIEFSDGRAYSYVVAIGAGPPLAPFARDLGAGRAAPIVDALLKDLARGA